MPLEPGQPDELAGAQLERRAPRAPTSPGWRCGRWRPPPRSGGRRRSSAARARPRSPDRRSSVATVSPERMTVQRSPISAISSMRCEMKITAAPVGRAPRRSANRRSRVATSSAEVASSRIRMRGSRTSARARQHAWRSLSDSALGRLVQRRRRRRAARRGPRRAPAPLLLAGHGACEQRRRRPSRRSRAPSAARRRGPPGRPSRCRPRRRARGERQRVDAPPADLERAGVGPVDAGEDLHERATCPSRSRRRCSGPHRRAARRSSGSAPGWGRRPWRAPRRAARPHRRAQGRGRRGSDRVSGSRP